MGVQKRGIILTARDGHSMLPLQTVRKANKPVKLGAGAAVPCPYSVRFRRLFVSGGGYLVRGRFGFTA